MINDRRLEVLTTAGWVSYYWNSDHLPSIVKTLREAMFGVGSKGTPEVYYVDFQTMEEHPVHHGSVRSDVIVGYRISAVVPEPEHNHEECHDLQRRQLEMQERMVRCWEKEQGHGEDWKVDS